MKVFLSHSSADKPAVRRIKAALAPHVPKLWLDECELFPGDSLFGKIQTAIGESDCMLAFISENSIKSSWVQDELNAFLALEKTAPRPLVIPVMLDTTMPPPFLAQRLQVRMAGKSLGSVTKEILTGVLRSGVVRICPLVNTPFRCEPFSGEIEQFRATAIQGRLRTVFDTFELADMLVGTMEDVTDDYVDLLRAAIPRVFDTLAAVTPKVIEVSLSSDGSASGPMQAERVIQLIWRMVLLTLCSPVSQYVRREKLQRESPYNLAAAMREVDVVTPDTVQREGSLTVQITVRTAVWLKHHQSSVTQCLQLEFEGDKSKGINHATQIWLPRKYVRTDARLTPELDFLPYEWVTRVLPLIVANSVIDIGFRSGNTMDEIARVGLRVDDYVRYGLA